jgi:hypothetical protein
MDSPQFQRRFNRSQPLLQLSGFDRLNKPVANGFGLAGYR